MFHFTGKIGNIKMESNRTITIEIYRFIPMFKSNETNLYLQIIKIGKHIVKLFKKYFFMR